MSVYETDRAWSDRFIPEIKRIVGPLLMTVTPDEIDCTQAADLMVFTARDLKVAARVRRPGYARMYGHEFTVRLQRKSGVETEFSKIVNGWGDWMFYAHSDDEERGLALWWVLDLNAFRAALIRHSMLTRGPKVQWTDKDNRDGSTTFRSFDIRSFPESLVVSCSPEAEQIRRRPTLFASA